MLLKFFGAAGRQAAEAVGGIVFEGPQPGEPGAEYTGGFELTEQTANGWPVWQAAGGLDRYAFVGSNSRLFIGNGKSMRAGKASGWVRSAAAEPGALTPDQVQGGWHAFHGKAFVAAPALRARPWTAAEKAAAVQRAQQQEVAARQAAEDAGDMVVFGRRGYIVFRCSGSCADGFTTTLSRFCVTLGFVFACSDDRWDRLGGMQAVQRVRCAAGSLGGGGTPSCNHPVPSQGARFPGWRGPRAAPCPAV